MANPNRYMITKHVRVDARGLIKHIADCEEGEWYEGIGHITKDMEKPIRALARLVLTILDEQSEVDRGDY